MSKQNDLIGRRAMITGLGVGTVALAAGAGGARAAQGAAPAPRWQPTLDPQDAWMELPGQHRFMFDSTSPEGTGHSLHYARNFYTANKEGYGLAASALAVIIVLRAEPTVFGYNDKMWQKYGGELSKIVKLEQIHKVNPYNEAAEGLGNHGVTLSSLSTDGAHFAICGMGTRFISHLLAEKTQGNADDIHKEIAANLIPGGHLVSAGIAAVNRAQERGYALSYTN